jgi:hypothetical protein
METTLQSLVSLMNANDLPNGRITLSYLAYPKGRTIKIMLCFGGGQPTEVAHGDDITTADDPITAAQLFLSTS